MATWFLCPGCAAIYHALDAVRACVDLGKDDLREALQEFNQIYAPKGFRLRIPDVPGMEVMDVEGNIDQYDNAESNHGQPDE
ncbi:MAG: hypothetical protein M1492_03480 [Gammaproteobacteria bacterium]|nr:hypothetical protein [Gammaproteobacteria bacterium]